MSLPPCRVLAGSPVPGPGGVEHRLDPAAEPRGRLGLGVPDRLQRAQHRLRVDRLDRPVAEGRVGMGDQGLTPLPAMMLAFPPGATCCDQILGRSLKGMPGGRVAGSDRAVPRDQRVVAGLGDDVPRRLRLLPRLRQRYSREAAQPHVAHLALAHEPEHPGAPIGCSHVKVEAVTVGVPTRLDQRFYSRQRSACPCAWSHNQSHNSRWLHVNKLGR